MKGDNYMKKEEIVKQLEEELQRLVEATKIDYCEILKNRSDISKQIFIIASYLLESTVTGNMTKADIIKCLEEELQALPQASGFICDIVSERCKISEQIFKIADYLFNIA